MSPLLLVQSFFKLTCSLSLLRLRARSTKTLERELSDPAITAYQAHLPDGTLVGASIWMKEKKLSMEEMMEEVFYEPDDEDEESEEEGEEKDTGWTGLDVQFCMRYWASCSMVRRECFDGKEKDKEWW